MTGPDVPMPTASVQSKFNLTPKASQNFLVGGIIFAITCVLCGTGLLVAGVEMGWVLFALATVSMGCGFWAWRSSQPDVDLEGAASTELTLANGAKLSTDSRTLRSQTAVAGFLQICEAFQRQPLPEPDALYSNGVVVPNSAEQARARVDHINNDIQAQAANFQTLVNGPVDQPAVLQDPTQTTQQGDPSTALNGPAS